MCRSPIFTGKTSAPTQGYVLNQKPIKFAATQNDLGILVSNDLKWSSHVINIVAKANRMLGFLRRNCFHITDVNARRLLYLSLVRSHLSFGCEIWAPQGPSADLLRLEGIQRRATKFIFIYFYLKYFAITNNTDYNINNRYTETWLGDHHSSVG